MSKHTPGPWKASGECIVAEHASPTLLATLYTSDEEGRANARLIAKAPELVEALREALSWLDKLGSPNQPAGRILAVNASREKYRALLVEIDGAS